MSVWEGLALLGAGLFGIIIEIFVPAGGLIGIAGGGAIVAAVVLAYTRGGAQVGIIILASALVLTPATIMIAFKLFPATPIGKRFILGTAIGSGEDEKEAEARGIEVGITGTAVTALRPTGVATLVGKRYSVLTGGEYLSAGTVIEVVEVEGNRIKVREA